jgi:hypothetical protein
MENIVQQVSFKFTTFSQLILSKQQYKDAACTLEFLRTEFCFSDEEGFRIFAHTCQGINNLKISTPTRLMYLI